MAEGLHSLLYGDVMCAVSTGIMAVSGLKAYALRIDFRVFTLVVTQPDRLTTVELIRTSPLKIKGACQRAVRRDLECWALYGVLSRNWFTPLKGYYEYRRAVSPA